MSESTSSSSSGIGFFGLLTIVLVVAKLWGKIDWSWWWVFAPMFVGVAYALVCLALLAGVVALEWWIDRPSRRRLR